MSDDELWGTRRKKSDDQKKEIDDHIKMMISTRAGSARYRRRFLAFAMLMNGYSEQEVATELRRSLSWVSKVVSDYKRSGNASFKTKMATGVNAERRIRRNVRAGMLWTSKAPQMVMSLSLKDVIGIVFDKEGVQISTTEAWRILQNAKFRASGFMERRKLEKSENRQ